MNHPIKTQPAPAMHDTTDRNASDQPVTATGSLESFGKDDFDRNVWCVMGLPIDSVDIEAAVGAVLAATRDHKRLSFVTPNVNILVASQDDPALREKIVDSDLSLVDGAPLVKMAKALGVPIKSRCAGSDVFEALRNRPGFSGRQIKVFFFGGRDGAAEAANDVINAENSGITSVGFHNPGFGDVASMSSPEVIEEINEADPDFVLVSLGFAKGQAWIDYNKDCLNAPVLSHLGAVVDFVAGGVKRSPQWLSKLGGEWIWRIFQEPALWNRYFSDGIALARLAPKFLGRQGGDKSNVVAASIDVEKSDKAVVLRCRGDLGEGNIAVTKEHFRNALSLLEKTPSIGEVVLDLANANGLDASFWGMVLMLEKNARMLGAEIVVVNSGIGVQKQLLRNCLPYRLVAAPQLERELATKSGFAQAS